VTDYFPQRIVCLTEETTETLYLLGEERRIVGISGFTVRPARARKEKPKISAFTSANIDKILDLGPDLVLGFSDLQADIAADLIRKGIAVHIFNQRSVKEILDMIVTLGALVGRQQKALDWVGSIEKKISRIRRENEQKLVRPKVYFEEWPDPLITGIRWVSELIDIAGGEDCFSEFAEQKLAKDRILSDHREVIKREPDIIIGSWCGRKFRSDQVAGRAGWEKIPAIHNDQLFEIKSSNILQPGPAALTDGLDQIKSIIDNWFLSQIEAS